MKLTSPVRYFIGTWLATLSGFVSLIGGFAPELSTGQYPAMVLPIAKVVMAVSCVTVLVWFRSLFPKVRNRPSSTIAVTPLVGAVSVLLGITAVILYVAAPLTDEPGVEFTVSDFTRAGAVLLLAMIVWALGLWTAIRHENRS